MTTTLTNQPVLLDEHLAYLRDESGISEDVIRERGYHSLDARMVTQLVQLETHYPTVLQAEGWLAIPIIRPGGIVHGEVLRLYGRTPKSKYFWPSGVRQADDVHPWSQQYLMYLHLSIHITDGARKA